MEDSTQVQQAVGQEEWVEIHLAEEALGASEALAHREASKADSKT